MLELINSPELKSLFDLFTNTHHVIYLVGGTVRDLVEGKTTKDFDLCTPLRTYELEELLRYDFELDLYRSSLGTVIAKKNDVRFEITSFRVEHGVKNVRYPRYIRFTNSLYLDSKRRDFTCNSLYLSNYDELLDPQGGLKDIKNKTLKFIGCPKRRIKEDPLRIIRGIRFSLENNYSISDDLYKLFLKKSYMISYLKEVKYKELFKIFENVNKTDIKKYLELFKCMFKELSSDDWDLLLSDKTDNFDLRLCFIKLCNDFTKFSISKKDKQKVLEINL